MTIIKEICKTKSINMNYLLCFDKYKGTYSAEEVCNLTKTVLNSLLENKSILLPLADGGDGTLDCLLSYLPLVREDIEVTDPLGKKVNSYYLGDKRKKTAYLEMSLYSGLSLLSDKERNPLKTSSKGSGEATLAAIRSGYKTIVIGLGGSAEDDGGAGFLSGLGMKFLNKEGKTIAWLSNETLKDIKDIDDSEFKENIRGIQFVALSDVDNKLLGEDGATYVYARQKGAEEKDLPLLEENMKSFSSLVKQKTSADYSEFPGSGAAGGFGFALRSFCNASFFSGSDYLMNLASFTRRLKEADTVITGEGRTDLSTLEGKIIGKVIKESLAAQKKVILLSGSVSPSFRKEFQENSSVIISPLFKEGKFTKEKALLNKQELFSQALLKALQELKIREEEKQR